MRFVLSVLLAAVFSCLVVDEAKAITVDQARQIVLATGAPLDPEELVGILQRCSGSVEGSGMTFTAADDGDYCRITGSVPSLGATMVIIVASNGSQWTYVGFNETWTWFTVVLIDGTNDAVVTIQTSDGITATEVWEFVGDAWRRKADEEIDWSQVP